MASTLYLSTAEGVFTVKGNGSWKIEQQSLED